MKEVKISTEKCLAVYNILGNCKYGKLEDADKIRLWRIVRQLRPIGEQYSEDCKDAGEKMRSDEFKSLEAKMAELERKEMREFGDISTPQREQEFIMSLMSKNNEYSEYRRKLVEVSALIRKAVEDLAKQEVTINVEALGDDAFAKLMSSNEWTMKQVDLVGSVICD